MSPSSSLSRIVIEAAHEVSRELGAGFGESVYQQALGLELRERRLSVVERPLIVVKYRSAIVGEFHGDLLVEDELLVELEAVPALAGRHLTQGLSRLRAARLRSGLLFNFGRPRLELRRLGARARPSLRWAREGAPRASSLQLSTSR